MEHIVEQRHKETSVEYSDTFKKELDRRYEAYKNGTSKHVTAAESKKRILKILKNRT